MGSIEFFFGTGSRYSYLAAMRLPALLREAGATAHWRAVYSPELMRRAGSGAFASGTAKGQYSQDYRRRDVERWAAHLGVPYREPDLAGTDWRGMALWAVAAELHGGGADFCAALLRRSFGEGRPPGVEDLAGLAEVCGLSAGSLIDLVRTGAAEKAHQQNIDAALAAGAFGVPTFLTEDGALFWGQDRMPLLAHHLQLKRGG